MVALKARDDCMQSALIGCVVDVGESVFAVVGVKGNAQQATFAAGDDTPTNIEKRFVSNDMLVVDSANHALLFDHEQATTTVTSMSRVHRFPET